jgi:hypothetical protein
MHDAHPSELADAAQLRVLLKAECVARHVGRASFYNSYIILISSVDIQLILDAHSTKVAAREAECAARRVGTGRASFYKTYKSLLYF